MSDSFILLPDPLDPSLVLAMVSAFVAVIAITPGVIKYALKVFTRLNIDKIITFAMHGKSKQYV
jgi:hypothetical protein